MSREQLHEALMPADVIRCATAWVRERVNPGAQERDVVGAECPPHLLREAYDLGLFGLALPRDLGGLGADLRTWGLALEQLGYASADASFPALLSARVWVTDTLYATARPDVVDRYVRPMARAELF